jgi:hypothetical protein
MGLMSVAELRGLAEFDTPEGVTDESMIPAPGIFTSGGKTVARYASPQEVERQLRSAYLERSVTLDPSQLPDPSQLQLPGFYQAPMALKQMGYDPFAVMRWWAQAQWAGSPWYGGQQPGQWGGYSSYGTTGLRGTERPWWLSPPAVIAAGLIAYSILPKGDAPSPRFANPPKKRSWGALVRRGRKHRRRKSAGKRRSGRRSARS